MPQKPSYVKAMSWFSRIGGLAIALIGIAVLVGWVLDVGFLKSVLPGLTYMRVNAAFGFLAAGTALWFVHSSHRWATTLVGVLSVAVVLVGGLTLAEFIFGIDLGVDTIFYKAGIAGEAAFPDRMSVSAAFNFFFIGLALLALRTRRSRFIADHAYVLAVPPFFVATVGIVGYAYDVTSLYQIGIFAALALHSAVASFLLSLAILLAKPGSGIAKIIVSDSAGGSVARLLIPTLSLILIVVSRLRLAGQIEGLYSINFGSALSLVANATVTILAVVFIAFKLHKVDVKRGLAEAEIIAINEALEQRVLERTKELKDSLADVKQLTGMLPICAWCRKVRNDKDYWQSVEQYITDKTDATFSHGICPECYDGVMLEQKIMKKQGTVTE